MTAKKIENNEPCAVGEALGVIGGKWKLQIIFQINDQKRRFGALKRLIPAISEKMLIQELKKLAETGIIKRKAFKEIPPKVEYSLTEEGLKVLPIILHLEEFGKGLIEKNNR